MSRIIHLLVFFAAGILFSCRGKERPRKLEVAVESVAVEPAPAAPSAGSGLKIATVDMQRLFKEYRPTNEAQKEINVERARIQKDNNDRLARIRELDTLIGEIHGQLEDPACSESRKQALLEEWHLKQQERVELDRERREFLQRRNQSLNEKTVQRMKGILEEIRKRVEEKAKAEDYDHVLDKSGMSTVQVPFIPYAKDANDLTGRLLADLNAGTTPPENAEAGGAAGEVVEDSD